MSVRVWAAAFGLAISCAASEPFAQSSGPSFPVESIAIPAGTGLPDQKPIDIRGLHTGMPGTAALAVLQEHYKAQPNNKLNVRMKTLRHANAPFAAYAFNSTYGPGADLLGVALTSNANGNQVVSIIRDTSYATGKEVNVAETLAAIKQKYGEPSILEEGSASILMRYGYKDGKIVQSKVPCAGLTRISELSLRDDDIIRLDAWFATMANAIKSDVATAYSDGAQGCDAAMYVVITYAYQNGRPNEKAASRVKFVFFDSARFRASAARDLTVQEELEDKAKKGAPAGSGASKL